MAHPSFLLIGAQKAGTTSLYHYLGQHPQIYTSPLKEPHFFLESALKPGQYYPGQKIRLWPNRITHLRTYQNLFASATSIHRAVGEASVWYLYRAEVAAKLIHRYQSDMKLIAILRNPVDRCFSDFKQGLTLGYEQLFNFGEAIQADHTHFKNQTGLSAHYVPQGFYHEQLEIYFKIFPQQQIKIYLYEDLKNDPTSLLQDIFRFLDVDVDFMPDLAEKKNVTSRSYQILAPKHTLWKLLIGTTIIADTASKQQTFHTWRTGHYHRNISPYSSLFRKGLRFLSQNPARRRLLAMLMYRCGLMYEVKVQPTLEPHIRQSLIEIYQADILALERLLQRDLSAWL